MKVHQLKPNDKFIYFGDVFVFHGIDGMYAKITKVKNDAPMLLHVGVEVEKVYD